MTTDNPKFRKKRFKLVPLCQKGPWMIKKAMGAPALLATKLETRYYKGDNYLECVVDVGSSFIAEKILGMVSGALTELVIDLGYVIEGKKVEELPERLLGGCRMQYVNLKDLEYRRDDP